METEIEPANPLASGSPIIVTVTRSHPDPRLWGYVADLLEVRGHEALVRFRLKLRNEVRDAWISLRHLRFD